VREDQTVTNLLFDICKWFCR